MKGLLAELDCETFILDLSPCLAEITLNGLDYRVLDKHTLEVDLHKSQTLNLVFKQLSEQGVDVLSMRNKSNRLEALFVNLISKNELSKVAN